MFKIGYIVDNEREDERQTNIQRIKEQFDYIQYINEKFNLGLDLVLIDDYTKEECDLVIYELFGVKSDKIYWHTYFNKAKGNPKWLFFDIGEPHHIGLTQFTGISDNEMGCCWEDDRILRTLCNYKHPYKGYSISTYENTPHNFQSIPFLKWGYYVKINDLIKSGELQKNRETKKEHFCSMVLSDTTPERYNFFNYMKDNYKKIRSFGNCRKNMGNIYYEDTILNNIIPKYKFCVCFENTRSDYNEAYITEKIYKAFEWGTVPIYWGEDHYIYEFLNKDSFINLTGKTLDESLEIIKEIDNNDDLYYKMLYANPLNKTYNFKKLWDDIDLFYKKILTENI